MMGFFDKFHSILEDGVPMKMVLSKNGSRMVVCIVPEINDVSNIEPAVISGDPAALDEHFFEAIGQGVQLTGIHLQEMKIKEDQKKSSSASKKEEKKASAPSLFDQKKEEKKAEEKPKQKEEKKAEEKPKQEEEKKAEEEKKYEAKNGDVVEAASLDEGEDITASDDDETPAPNEPENSDESEDSDEFLIDDDDESWEDL